jgi:hypothetical protein
MIFGNFSSPVREKPPVKAIDENEGKKFFLNLGLQRSATD